MKRALLRLMLGFIMLGVFQIHAFAGSFSAFGSKTFIRGSGKPITETATFSIKSTNTSYTLKIYNGGINSEYSKVTSAVIKLNGSIIFDTGDFNPQISSLKKQVNVSISNQLQVELRSAPGSGLTILLEGEDDSPPAVSITMPSNGSYTNNPSLTVSGTAMDSISWVNTLYVNSSGAVLSGESYTANISLTEGPNTITATATDAAGNTGNTSVSVILDTIPPKITLDPLPSLTNKPQLTITGRIEDASPITALMINGAAPATLSNNTFMAAVNLTEGNNTIHIAATDKAGNSASASTGVILDTIPPTLTISSPSANTTLNTPSITITGHASDELSGISTVAIDGINAAINGGVYSASNVQLAEGPNTITVTATDNAGNASSSSVSVTLDTTAPVISMTSPINGSTVNTGAITVTGSIDDNSATVTVNGINTIVSNNTFTAGIKLIEGSNTIAITAKDLAGNTNTTSISVILDTTPPIINIASPAHRATITTSSITVTGTMDDTAVVSVNGLNATVSNNSFSISNIKLVEGANTITVAATDQAGNTNSSLIMVNLDTTAPIITIFSPTDGSTASTDMVEVMGLIDDNAATVTVNGIAATVTNNTFTASSGIRLIKGSNPIMVTAVDLAGNISTTTINVTYASDITPPEITILEPSNNSTVDTSTVSIVGLIDDNNATVAVNGINVKLLYNRFNSTVQLTEGTNTITVTAVDQAGNTSTVYINLSYKPLPTDPDAIAISIRWPISGSTVSTNPVNVIGYINDTGAIVTVNGIIAKVIEDRNAFEAYGIKLMPGANTITTTATDSLGNTVKTSITVFYASGPSIRILSPTNGETCKTNTINVTGTIGDNNVTVIVNNRPAVIEGNIFTASDITLVEGENTITATAVDSSGSRSTASVTVNYTDRDIMPPVIYDTYPTSGMVLNRNVTTITGAIDVDASAVTLWQWDYDADIDDWNWIEKSSGSVTENTFEIRDIQLKEEYNFLAVKAIDAAGNSSWYAIQLYVDTIAPEIGITDPIDGSYTRINSIGVTGTTSEPVTITLNGNDYSYVSVTNFSISATLAEGENTITLTAADQAGNTSTASVKIFCDSIAPAMTNISPDVSHSYTATDTITIAGNIDDSTATIKIQHSYIDGLERKWVDDGTAVVAGNTFEFRDFHLTEGWNKFRIIATDPYGNESVIYKDINLDTIKPAISIVSPILSSSGPFFTRYGTITIKGTISEPAYASMNGIKIENWQNNEAFEVKGLPLTVGQNEFTITATDVAGNSSSKTIVVYLDTTRPVVTITSPASGTGTSDTITVTGTVDEEYLDTLYVYNGTTQSKTTNSEITNGPFTVSGVKLINGLNYIYAVAIDKAGNAGSMLIEMTYQQKTDTTAPYIYAPIRVTSVNTSTFTVSGYINDNTATVTVNGMNATVADNSFTLDYPLTLGANTITVIATDPAGNTTTYTFTITYDITPPTVTSTGPGFNETGVPLNTAITINFSEPVHYITIEDYNFTLMNGSIAVPGALTSSGGTVTFTPQNQLRPETIYTFTVKGGNSGVMDRAGNHLTSDYDWNFKTVTLPIEITEPSDGETINKANVILKGRINYQTQEVGVTVNGVIAGINGQNWTAIVPLQVGQNTIEAIATDTTGNTNKQSITVNTQTTDQPVKITTNPQSGIAPLNTTFTIDTSISNPITSYRIDFEGDGIADMETTSKDGITHAYDTPGIYYPTVTVTDSQNNAYTESTMVNVLDKTEMDVLLKGKWEGMKGAMGQGNIDTALIFIATSSQEKYRTGFNLLKDQMAAIFSLPEELRLTEISENVATYYDVVLEEDGRKHAYPVTFIRDVNGLWKILSF